MTKVTTHLKQFLSQSPQLKLVAKQGLTWWQQRQLDLEIAYYRSAAATQPSKAIVYHKLGNSLVKKGHLDDAITAYQRATELNPNFFGLYQKLGDTLSKQRKWEKAISAYRQAVEMNPNAWRAYLSLGSLFAMQKQWGEALDCYLNAVKIESTFHKSDIRLEIEPLCQELKENSESFLPYYKLGTFLARHRQWDGAVAAFLRALELNPLHNWWHYPNLWNTLTERNFLEDAAQIYKRVLEQSPKPILSCINLGEILTKQGKINEAIECYQTASYNQTLRFYPRFANQNWDLDRIQSPQFCIIGTQKGGTSSLYYYMSQHPNILTPIKKEIHFWSTNFHHGIKWYLSHFPPTSSEQNTISGEASTNYFDFDRVSARMYEYFPKTKLIVILRNPVDRAISHYHHSVREGWEHRPLEEAIELQMKKIKKNQNYWNQQGNYVGRGVYIKFLTNWMSIFPREQFLILKSQDFYQDPEKVLSQVFQFLGLPDCSLQEYKKYNAGSYAEVSPSIRRELSDYYRPYNQQLEEYLGLDLNWE